MVWMLGDGFDCYANMTDMGRGLWDATPTGGFSGPAGSRFTSGQYYGFGGNASQLVKTFSSNESTLYFAFAHLHGPALGTAAPDLYILLRDGATNQCTLCFNSDGGIQLRSGSQTGTILATYASAFQSNLWTHFQIRVVIDNVNGSFTVRKNGQLTDTFTATGLNTRGGTANNYVNNVNFSANGTSGVNAIDDLLIFSGSGAAPNTWVGDVRAVCLMPLVETAQKQFATTTPTFTYSPGNVDTNGPPPANTLIGIGPLAVPRSGKLTKLQLTGSGSAATGNVRVAIYANDGMIPTVNSPGTLLGQSSVVTNPGTGLIDFAFSPGLDLSAGRLYYFAYLADVAWTIQQALIQPNAYSMAFAYSSTGFPNPAVFSAVPNPGSSFQMRFTIPVSGQVVAVSELLANGDTDFVYDSTVGEEDLYDMDNLQQTPVSVVAVQSRVFIKKSDAGTRNAQVRVASGGTEVGGTDTPLASSYTFLSKIDTVDPATGAPWTAAGINGLRVGQKVTL